MVLSIWNSVKMTVIGTAITTFTCLITAYPVSKKYLVGRRGIMVYIIFTMLFGGGLIPSYLLVSSIFPDSMWAIIIPGALAPYYLILIRNYFMSIPDSLEEAATLDCASNMRIFLTISLPLSTPVIATIVLCCAVSIWINWFGPMLYITSKDKYPIQYMIQQLLNAVDSMLGGSSSTGIIPSESVKMAAVVTASLPIIIVYPFLQKYFINGMMMGSVKE